MAVSTKKLDKLENDIKELISDIDKLDSLLHGQKGLTDYDNIKRVRKLNKALGHKFYELQEEHTLELIKVLEKKHG